MKKSVVSNDVTLVPIHCKTLHLPAVARNFQALAQQALQEQKSHAQYLETLLETEVEERERNVIQRRLQEAKFPRVKTLEEFNFWKAPHIPAAVVKSVPTMDIRGRISGPLPIKVAPRTVPASLPLRIR